MSQAIMSTILNPQTTLSLNLNGVKLIEASAGTGKTYTISNLYLRYIIEGRSVSEILVVTFTKAATEELRGRIRERLHEALMLIENPKETSDGFLRLLLEDITTKDKSNIKLLTDRLRLAVRSMDEASINTIHGFCQRALTDHAFNSGQSFDIEMAEDDTQLWQSAIKDWWRKSAYNLSAFELSLFVGSLGSLDYLMKLQKPLQGIESKELIPDVKQDLETFFNDFKKNVNQLKKQWVKRSDEIIGIIENSDALSRAKDKYKQDRLDVIFVAVNEFFTSEELTTIPEEFDALSSKQIHMGCTPKKRGTDASLEDEFFSDCQKIVDDRDVYLKVCLLKDVTEYARKHVDAAKQQSQEISFSDQLTRLYDALKGEQGDALAKNLRQRLPVAMIDEFQDTDSIQYGIFNHVYQGQDNTALIMIGDPKQAIYSFRGGDIFTYMKARKDAGTNRYTLDTNWRSVPDLITAVNTIFENRDAPFIYNDTIDFHPINFASEEERQKPHENLMRNGEAVTPLSIWHIPLDDKNKAQSKTMVSEQMAISTAAEIAQLIKDGQDGCLTLGDKSVKPGDIAVLVRSGYEGVLLRDRLMEYNIPAVTVGRDKVFESDEAYSLQLLLEAVIHPSNRSILRAALSSDLFAYSYVQIANIIDNDDSWAEYGEQMRELNRLWQDKGFMSMFQHLLKNLDVGLQIANAPDSERRMTNLLHLSELLQQASRVNPGHEALLSWYQQQTKESSEEAELRIESDEELVKIVTIHKSKGLEYPIVFLPWMWTCRGLSCGKELISFHDESNNAYLDAAADKESISCILSEKERLAEDLRLAYVALTRARAKVYLAWGYIKTGGQSSCDSGTTALAYLFHPNQNPDDFNTDYPKVFSPNSGEQVEGDLNALVKKSGNTIEVLPVPIRESISDITINPPQPLSLVFKKFEGAISTNWRVNSFSSLTRDIHQTPHGGSPRSGTDPVLDFPAGSNVGLFLHLLLENLDFQNNVTKQSRGLTVKFAARFGLDKDQHADTIVDWVDKILLTELGSNRLRLADISQQKRLNELAFDFSIKSLDISALNNVLDEHADCSLEKVVVSDFKGLITGVIDLVFEHEGKYYLADYKSNFLGGALEDYTPSNLQKAVYERRYDLQYLIYTLALHRYLKTRINDYDYKTHFGGVYYLFLRGMRPETGTDYGVYYNQPDQALIEKLDTEYFH